MRDARLRLLGEGPALNAVKLQVHPPDTRYAQHPPQQQFPTCERQREVGEQEEIDGAVAEEDGQSE